MTLDEMQFTEVNAYFVKRTKPGDFTPPKITLSTFPSVKFIEKTSYEHILHIFFIKLISSVPLQTVMMQTQQYKWIPIKSTFHLALLDQLFHISSVWNYLKMQLPKMSIFKNNK